MISLQKITTQFIDFEDRVRISAVSSDNETLILWLTQRLLIRVVKRCLTFLEEETNKPTQKSKHSGGNLEKQSTSIAPIEKAVSVKKNCRSLLIREVDLKYYQSRLSIVFRQDSENQASLELNHLQLCQLMTIIFKVWHQAEWPIEVWPESINFLTDAETTSKIVLH